MVALIYNTSGLRERRTLWMGLIGHTELTGELTRALEPL